jgi:hypothetical protein
LFANERSQAAVATSRRFGGFPSLPMASQGQGRLVGAQLAELPISKALAAALNGTLDPAAAAEQAQVDLEEIAWTIN